MAAASRRHDLDERTGGACCPTSRLHDLHCDLHGGAAGMRNLADMLAIDVRPFAKQDPDVGRYEIGRPK